MEKMSNAETNLQAGNMPKYSGKFYDSCHLFLATRLNFAEQLLPKTLILSQKSCIEGIFQPRSRQEEKIQPFNVGSLADRMTIRLGNFANNCRLFLATRLGMLALDA